jgi:hypothetical protein
MNGNQNGGELNTRTHSRSSTTSTWGGTKIGMGDLIGGTNPTLSAVASNSGDGDGAASPESSRRSPPRHRHQAGAAGGGTPEAESTKTPVVRACGRGKEKQAAVGPSHTRTAYMRPRPRWTLIFSGLQPMQFVLAHHFLYIFFITILQK